MPGTIIFKPIEANLTHKTDIITKMSPYCLFEVGGIKVKGEVCKKGGKHPHWGDVITVPATNKSVAMLEVMDKDKITKDDPIGTCMIDLQEIQSTGHVSKWYPLTYKNKPAGEILLEADYQPSSSSFSNEGQTFQRGQIGMSQAGLYQQEGFVGSHGRSFNQESFGTGHSSLHEGLQVSTEQRQIIEPHTFMKQVDVVETRPYLKEVEVMEPCKVVKDVQVTEAVPVKKQIEVVHPEVVVKEIEVMEPRLVTKEIKVIENVPVMKKVDVVEPRTFIQEFETLEPRTFTKQVELTEHVPVKKQVEVSEPITLKKAVEFAQPIITTKTITKEIKPAVIVDEKVETSIGPATIVGVETNFTQEAVVDKFSQFRISEQERLLGQERLVGEERLLEQRRLREQERLREEERLLEQGRLHQGNVGYQSEGYTSNFQRNKHRSFAGNKVSESQGDLLPNP